MRLIFSVLLMLLLAACATQQGAGKGSGNTPLGSGDLAKAAKNPSLAANPALRNATANKMIDVDDGSVKSLALGNGNLWDRIRGGFQIPDLKTDRVDMQTAWYAERPAYVERMTGRAQKYLYHIVEELEARHMPTELALLPFVESAYNPQALSVAKAAGMWQFVPGTGRTYNLKQNMFEDERRDVLASTSAALDYLSRLHDMFGDWYLALAAYNWGEGNVQRTIARNAAKGLPTDYVDLPLPNETHNYVPKLQAIKNIVNNPQTYGLTLASIPNHPYFVTVTTGNDIDVTVAAKLAGLTMDEFRSLNPSFTKPVILGATQPQILLPFENAESFERNLKSYDGTLSTWTTYTVSERARPSALAAKNGVDARTLMSVNKIPAGMRLKPGSTVLVPKTDADADEDISADVAESAVLAMEPDVPDIRKMLIRVRRTQSVTEIARRYSLKVGQVRAWNHLRGSRVAPGQRLVLHVPVGRPMPEEPGPILAAGGIRRIDTRVATGHAKDRGIVKVSTHASIARTGASSKRAVHSSARPDPKVKRVSARIPAHASAPAPGKKKASGTPQHHK